MGFCLHKVYNNFDNSVTTPHFMVQIVTLVEVQVDTSSFGVTTTIFKKCLEAVQLDYMMDQILMLGPG